MDNERNLREDIAGCRYLSVTIKNAGLEEHKVIVIYAQNDYDLLMNN
jgi:hypothetical protein